MSDYDQFAPFYDVLMGDRSDVIAVVRDAITRYHPASRSLLELGCGTGSILAGFATTHELSGVDLSAKMLKIAQHRLPDANLKCADLTGLNLHQKYDVIICVFDTLNHILLLSGWEEVFRRAKKHLRTNGLFIFDIDTIGRLQDLAAGPGYTQNLATGTADLIVTAITASEVEWHITIQDNSRAGAIQVYEEVVREVSFPLEETRSILAKYFELLESFDSDGSFPSEQSDRVYFVCR